MKNNKVIISGPFDPHTLTRTLYFKACKIIKKITTPPPDPNPTPTPLPTPKPTKPELPPGPPCCAKPTYQWLYGKLKCASCGMVYTWTNKCLPPPADPCKNQCPSEEPAVLCCPQPSYVGMCGGTMCTSCGPQTNQDPPTVTVSNQVCVPQSHHGYGCACGCGQLKPCHFIYDDNTPSCTIM